MSEYQYFEWQTVNRLLTEAEQIAVGRLSSHIEVSSSQAVVTYSWGNFKHDPRQVLVGFFRRAPLHGKLGQPPASVSFPGGTVESGSDRTVLRAGSDHIQNPWRV
jgi:hypothetical protein